MLTTKTIAAAIALGASLTLSSSIHAAFTTVENFESYGSSGELNAAWVATIGAPFIALESSTICEGAKALSLTYTGAESALTNMVKLTFAANQDWSSNTVFTFNYGGNGNTGDDILVQFLDQTGAVLDSRRITGGAAAVPCSQASLNLFGMPGLQAVRGIQIGVIAGGVASSGTVYFDRFEVGNRGVLSVLGSSLALGIGSSGDKNNQYVSGGSLSNGYAAHLMMTQATNGWRVVNQSIGGDTTARVISRFNRDEVPVRADAVQIGLSLGNEGLPGAANPKAVFDQFFTGITNLIAMSRSNEILPLIGNQYPRNAYTPAEYAWLKKMDLLLNTLDVPSANFLGATDDGSGHWVNNSFINLGTSDGIHPNDAGHYEMFLTIVPSVFDALKMGKPTPRWGSKARFLRIAGDEVQPAPLSFSPSLTVHSFTTSFRVRSIQPGTVASITTTTPSAHPTVEISAGDLVYAGANGTVVHSGVSGLDGAWHDIVVAHSWARGLTWFYVDGVLAGTVSERLAPVKFVLGGRGDATTRPGSPEQAEYQNWLVHRSMMNAEEVRAQFQGRFQQASLEVFAPLDDESFIQNGSATNCAQSLSIAAVNAASGNMRSVPAAESPANLLLSTNATQTVILNWTDPASAEQDEYVVERSTAGGRWANIATLPAHTATYTDSAVGRGTNYQYRVSYSKSGWRSDFALSEVVQLVRTNLPVVFVDFGPNDIANGHITPSPDVNGNYWNNLVSTANGSTITDLISSDNQPTTIALRLTSGSWAANGIQNGGLLNPNPTLLDEFAVATATEDYFYINQNFGSANARQTMLISGLNPNLAYNLALFGTRNTAGTRTTIYSVTDANGTHSTNLVTSGAAANSGTNPSNTAGNDKTIVTLNRLAPDRFGQMTVAVQVGDAANFAYIGAMKMTATALPPVFGLSPASQTLRAGTSNVLTVLAQSSEPVQYQWYFGNGRLPGETNATLVLAPVLYTNAGSYHVVASNALGMATSAVAVVTVTEPTSQPRSILIDFGPNDGANGVITSSPDFTGKYWNNLTSGSSVPNGLSLANMVAADNSPTPIDVTIVSGGWMNNGIQNGGLLAPNPALLGDLAVATATEDYFFVQGANGTTGTLRLDGLDPASVYTLSFFASRNAADTRTSRYSVTDANGIHRIDLQTTGEGAGSPALPYGNDDTIVSLTGLKPNGTGQLTLAVSIVNGGFAYLGAMRIETEGNPRANSTFLPPGQIEGGWRFQFSVTPGYAYHVERATDVSGPWTDLGPVIPAANGWCEFNETDAPLAQAFYRIVAN